MASLISSSVFLIISLPMLHVDFSDPLVLYSCNSLLSWKNLSNVLGNMLLKNLYVNIAVATLLISSRGKTASFLNNGFRKKNGQ